MRALFYHPHSVWNGEARAFVAAARGLAQRGWQVSVACCEDSVVQQRAAEAGVEVFPIPEGRSWIGASGDLRRAIREGFVEVVFVHDEDAQLAAAAGVWRASRGAVVRRVGAGGVLTLGSGARTALRTTSTAFLFTWPEQAAGLPAGLRAIETVVADVGVTVPDDPAATPGAPPAPVPRVGGREERRIVCVYEPTAPRARIATVLRTVAMLAPRHPELRVALVGPGSDDEALRMHAAALGINRIVGHLGERDDARRVIAEAHIGWVVADRDDGAYGALDCMAARVPVLAERGSVAARYVADAITGVHLPPSDVPGTAAVLAQLLAADEQRDAMGVAGRARVVRSFTEAAMVDGFARVAATARDRAKWTVT